MSANEFTLEGVVYVAKESTASLCSGCTFGDHPELCEQAPKCYNFQRTDNRNVVFVKKD